MTNLEYSNEVLEQIEQYASIYLKISDMAVILDVPCEQLREDIADRSTEVSKRYHRGKAESKVKLLHQEMQLAYVGSPLALENAQKNLTVCCNSIAAPTAEANSSLFILHSSLQNAITEYHRYCPR